MSLIGHAKVEVTAGELQIKLYETGYPVGHAPGQEDNLPQTMSDTLSPKKKADNSIYLFNHLKFTILYNDFHGQEKRRVVGFEVLAGLLLKASYTSSLRPNTRRFSVSSVSRFLLDSCDCFFKSVCRIRP